MDQRTFEGTWEDISRKVGKLAGLRVRLTILSPDSSPAEPLDRSLAQVLEDDENLNHSLPPSPTEQGWAQGVVEKYRRQGFNL